MTPAGWASQSSVLHKCQSQCKLKNMNAYGRDSNQTKKPGRSSRKLGYPMIEPKEKK